MNSMQVPEYNRNAVAGEQEMLLDEIYESVAEEFKPTNFTSNEIDTPTVVKNVQDARRQCGFHSNKICVRYTKGNVSSMDRLSEIFNELDYSEKIDTYKFSKVTFLSSMIIIPRYDIFENVEDMGGIDFTVNNTPYSHSAAVTNHFFPTKIMHERQQDRDRMNKLPRGSNFLVNQERAQGTMQIKTSSGIRGNIALMDERRTGININIHREGRLEDSLVDSAKISIAAYVLRPRGMYAVMNLMHIPLESKSILVGRTVEIRSSVDNMRRHLRVMDELIKK